MVGGVAVGVVLSGRATLGDENLDVLTDTGIESIRSMFDYVETDRSTEILRCGLVLRRSGR